MNPRLLPLLMCSLLLALGCEEGDYSLTSVRVCITPFEDANLEAAAKDALARCGMSNLTCDLISSPLMGLNASSLGIKSLTGLENFMMLVTLDLGGNSITNIGPLSDLEGLTWLTLDANPDLSNIQPLLRNPGLGKGDLVRLQATNVSCADVAALQDKGVTVFSDCP